MLYLFNKFCTTRPSACRSLGQNFLTDDVILADIVAASGVRSGDLVIEVGPGTGNLTRHLVAAGAQVTAVEKDDTLVERLREEFKGVANLQLVHGDVLRVGVERIIEDMIQQQRQAGDEADPSPSPAAGPSPLAAAEPSSSGQVALPRVKVVANLPYNITKEFLKSMLPKGAYVTELNIMIQEEVARRLLNKKPGASDYRAMNIFVHYFSKPKYRFLIPKEKYFPVPGVDGALVTFALLPPARRLSVPTERGFISLFRKAFLSRRKMIRNNMHPLYSSKQVDQALTSAKLRPDARAQDLSVEHFARFHWKLNDLMLAEALGPADREEDNDDIDM